MKLYSKSEILQLITKFVQEKKDPVLEILGPTASGKTGFALELAKAFGPAEIISADSRQIYRDLDISAAKISSSDQQGIPHWGLDLLTPNQEFSAFQFQRFAFEKIEEIRSRGALPILCGGTMLWLDAVSENYIFSDKGKKSVERGKPKWSFLKVGMWWDRKALYERINERARKQFSAGLLDETRKVFSRYQVSRSAMTSFGLREIQQCLAGEISSERALELNQQRNRNYAKRQLTWWRGRDDVVWTDLQ